MSVPPTLTEAQMHAAAMARKLPPPERYRWHAIWWHLDSKVHRPSAASSLEYASNLLRLRRDMLARPEHYRRKPDHLTDYQWSKE